MSRRRCMVDTTNSMVPATTMLSVDRLWKSSPNGAPVGLTKAQASRQCPLHMLASVTGPCRSPFCGLYNVKLIFACTCLKCTHAYDCMIEAVSKEVCWCSSLFCESMANHVDQTVESDVCDFPDNIFTSFAIIWATKTEWAIVRKKDRRREAKLAPAPQYLHRCLNKNVLVQIYICVRRVDSALL